MEFQPLESAFFQVVHKYRPQVESLQARLNSEEGLSVLPSANLAESQKQALLFGHFFQGLDKPLKVERSEMKEESPRAFVARHKIQHGGFNTLILTQPVNQQEVHTLRDRSFLMRFGIVRIGFIRRHARSVKQRWRFNYRTRPGLFPGSPVYYLMGF